MQRPTRHLWNDILRGQRLRFAGALFCVAITAFLTFVPAQILRYTIDVVIGGQTMALPRWLDRFLLSLGGVQLWHCAVAMVVAARVSGVFTYLRTLLSADASERAARNLRNRLYDHLQRLPYDTLHHMGTGDLLQRCTSDVEMLRRFLSTQIAEIGRAVSMLAFALALMLPMHVAMTFVSLACVPLVFFFSYGYFALVRRRFRSAEEAEGRMSVVLQENLTGVRVVRAFGQQAYEVNKFDEASRTFRDRSRRMVSLMAYYWAGSDLMIYAQLIATLVAGLAYVQSGAITVGTLMTFITYTSSLLWPIRQMGRILSDLGKTFVALERIDAILRQPVECDAPNAQTPVIRGQITFEHVTFGYEAQTDVLHDVSFTVQPGQTIGILGATGSGKSSLVSLLQRFYDPREGAILLDGVDIRQIQRAWLRRHVGIVLQEPFLYSRTLGENIAITRPQADAAEIWEAARIASLDTVPQDFPQGFDTIVGERGVTLSGGQKQRVAIARMIMQQTPIMIFDDSLSALDTQTDAAIRQALRTQRRRATTFLISHRIDTLSEADLILVLEQGRIVQKGTHDALIHQPGLYRRIWQLQGAQQKEGTR